MALNVLEIHRMAIVNGPGIRTMVHLMGCPLHCVWCSTPESQSVEPLLFHNINNCIGCGRCVRACQRDALTIKNGVSFLDRDKCNACMDCTKVCYTLSLKPTGMPMGVTDIYNEIRKDKNFFETSGGGVVFSGGEPMMSFGKEFLILLRMLKEDGISIGIDTCGYAPAYQYREIAEYTDFFLWDLKQMNPFLHRKYTGTDNALIIQNLRMVDELGCDIYLRCPTIPGYTDDQNNLKAICTLAKELKHVKEIHILGLHHLGTVRYENHGMRDPVAKIPLQEENDLKKRKAYVEKMGFRGKIIR